MQVYLQEARPVHIFVVFFLRRAQGLFVFYSMLFIVIAHCLSVLAFFEGFSPSSNLHGQTLRTFDRAVP